MAGEVKVLADGVQRIVLRAPSDTKTISTKKTILDRLATPKPPQQPILWPSSYLKNSIKEQTLLEYVEDFRRQFVQLFPHRRPLLLCPLNEAKVRKFVSTTICPSLLPYNDVYDIQPCAEFVADFLTYIPLDEPTKLPDLLPSSSTLLLTPQRTADCLDASIFLVSLLRGAGHAAYVVSGYAPQWITEADQSQVNCPLLDNSAEEARKAREKFEQEQAERRKTARFTIPTRPEHKSKYVAAREAEELAEKERIRKEEEEKNKIVVEKAVDPLHGSRVHVWVLVMRGRRDQPDDVFIEASTGTIYSIQHSPYLGIEAVWNELNYWVNVQKTQVPSQMVYDLSNITNWEYVLIDERRAAAVSKLNNNTSSTTRHSVLTDFETAKDGEEAKEEREVPPEDQPDSRDILDAPLSWASKITIDRVTFQARYPGGSKQVRYKNCLVEKYSDYNEPLRGLIRRITIYEDEECTKVVEIRETFKHRKDYLRERRTYPLLSRTHCMFDPGRPSGLRDFIVTGEKHRAFEFYHGARVDGMIKREERVGEKVIEEYANRDDFLIYRSVAVDTSPAHTLATRRHKVFSISLGKGSAEQPIRKITEKFARNMKLDAEHDVRKRTHLMMQGTIRLDYHYGEKHITHSRHVIDKADKLDQSETEGPSENSLGSMLRVSSTWTPPSRGEEQEMVARLLQIEKDLTTKVRDRETHMMELVQQLELQQHDVQLEKSIYDSAHEQAIQKLADSVGDSEQDASEAANKVDYLSPFLAQYPPGKPLTRRQAQQAKEECLGALKERLLERANIIQEHLDDEQQKLHQRQAMFKRQAGAGAGEEFNKFSEQALFRIDILNARRARHEELALKRYVEMDERLNNDPRLAILQQPDGM